MLPVSESEHARLLSGCYLFVTNANTHTRAHTQHAALVRFPFLTTTLASLTHTRAHTLSLFLFLPWHAAFSLWHTHFAASWEVQLWFAVATWPVTPIPPRHTHRHTHAAIVCFISPFALLTSLVFYCRKLLLHSCVFIICSDRKGPLSVCVCVCVCCPQWHSVVTAHTHTMQHSLSLCQTAIYFTHMHAHTCRKHAWQLHLCTHTHSVTPFLLLWRTHICSLGALWNSKRVCVCLGKSTSMPGCAWVSEVGVIFCESLRVCVCVTVHSCLTAGALHREAHTHTHTQRVHWMCAAAAAVGSNPRSTSTWRLFRGWSLSASTGIPIRSDLTPDQRWSSFFSLFTALIIFYSPFLGAKAEISPKDFMSW